MIVRGTDLRLDATHVKKKCTETAKQAFLSIIKNPTYFNGDIAILNFANVINRIVKKMAL